MNTFTEHVLSNRLCNLGSCVIRKWFLQHERGKIVDGMKERLIGILGKENVSDDPKTLDAFASDRSFAEPIRPVMAVKVKDVGQVQSVVKWANETKTPLVPVSSTGSHYRGDTVPSVPEAVVVDLSGMKKIHSINRQHRMAVVEPGVTYGEIQAALAKEGMTLSTAIAPKATKSVLASVLEVEPRLNALHQWNFIDPLRCMEVVWGDGVRMYTGEAGGAPAELEKQWATEKWQVSGTGPMMLDFYRLLTAAQGSMGIATWASLKCELLPKIHKLYFASASKLENLIDFVYRIIRFRFSDELLIVNGTTLATLIGESTDQVEALRNRLPRWAVLIGIAGRELLPEEKVKAQEESITGIAQQFGQKMVPSLPGATGDLVLNKLINPSGPKYWKETYKGAFQDLFFVTTLDRAPKFINAMYTLAIEEGYPANDIGIYIQPQNCGTSYHLEFTLPYCRESTVETRRTKELFAKASELFSGMGGYYYRPYGIWSRMQLNKDAQSYMTLRKLKGIFDPNDIMNPGKLSI
jgi:FAD/FMN-containing dehydrogenase